MCCRRRVQAAGGTAYQRFNTQDGYVEIEVPLYLEGGRIYVTDAQSSALIFGKVGTDFFHMDSSRDITVFDKPIMMEGTLGTDRLIKIPVRGDAPVGRLPLVPPARTLSLTQPAACTPLPVGLACTGGNGNSGASPHTSATRSRNPGPRST
jgi:hypothetical protein